MTVILYFTVMNEMNPEYNLEELSRAVELKLAEFGIRDGQRDGRISGVPDARTIRYYTTLGLLDPPKTSGRQARYGPRHLRQLIAIKLLQQASLSLAEIQTRLYGRTDTELEALLQTAAEQNRQRPAESVSLVYWQEIVIEPGLKIMAEAGWQSRLEPQVLEQRIRAALAALEAQPQNGQRRN